MRLSCTRFVLMLGLVLLAASAASAQCTWSLVSLTLSNGQLVGGTTQSGVGTVTASFSGPNCSTYWVAISANPPASISYVGNVPLSPSNPTANFSYSLPEYATQITPVTFTVSYTGIGASEAFPKLST